ncbi:glucose-1-phosphate thymidylyltransferase RfbA [Halovulum sp. GXIMD14793]
MTDRKGIVLAGGTGSRLFPVTLAISKQLMPIYDKPMIYYPISVLMLGDIREIALLTTPHDQVQFQRLLGDGSQWGLQFTYIVQDKPEGLSQAYLLADDFLAGAPSAMVLGDNIFVGDKFGERLLAVSRQQSGGTVFAYQVADPERYGVVGFDTDGTVLSIEEKPVRPASNYAITGLYYLDGSAPERARQIQPSARGELEIVDLLRSYLDDGSLTVQRIGRGYAWLDTGTHGSLLDAGNFVRTMEQRQGLQTGSPEEIAFEKGWITREQLLALAEPYEKNAYGSYLRRLAGA